MKELWLPVVGYEDQYLVSNTGKVWSKRWSREIGQRWLDGRYLAVNLYQSGKPRQKTRKVHQLVAEAFVGPRPDGLLCLHKDDNRSNNNAENLYWGTAKQNQIDCTKNGNRPSRIGERNPSAKLTEDQVRQIRTMEGSSTKVGALFGVSGSMVVLIRNRKKWAHVPD